jgi:hypothetical protein
LLAFTGRCWRIWSVNRLSTAQANYNNASELRSLVFAIAARIGI